MLVKTFVFRPPHIALYLLFLVFAGCSTNSQVVFKPKLDPETPVISTPQSPFLMQISSVLNDGHTLKIEGVISTKAPWYADKVSVNLVGYKDGIEVASIARPLKDFMSAEQLSQTAQGASQPKSPVLKEEELIAFAVSIPSKNISDYQVTLGWGNEATIASNKHVSWKEQGIVDLGVDSNCSSLDCLHIYAVEGSLINDGQEVIYGVSAILKLKQQDEIAGSNSLPDANAEEQVDLSPLNLLPGATQKVRLRFKQPLDPEIISGVRAEVQVKPSK